MTKLLLTSDTHGNYYHLRKAVLAHPDAHLLVHLGDGAEDLDDLALEFPDRRILQVQGNNDYGCALPLEAEITLEGIRIFYTHGHTYHVKYSLDELAQESARRGAQIALFGHTHIPYAEQHGGVFLINPGNLGGGEGFYGVLTLDGGQVSVDLCSLSPASN